MRMLCSGIRLTVILAIASVLGIAESDTRIVPLYAVAPSVFQTGLTSGVQFTILEANPNSTQQLLDGDQFTFGLNVAGASIVSLGAITVNGTGFGPANFTAVLSADSQQIVLTYRGPAVSF